MSMWRRTLPRRWLGVVPYVHACEGSVVKRTFFGLTGYRAWERAGRWISEQS